MRPDKDGWFDWTPARIEQLKAGITDGKSFAVIGAELGCGRNAAVGKAHRMKLRVARGGKRIATKVAPARVPQVAKKQQARPVVVPSKAKRERSAAERPKLGKADFNGGKPLAEGLSLRLLDSDAWDALPGTVPVPIEAHKTGCRWPIGDPLQPGFGFCGCETEGKAVYCSLHRRRAYVLGA